MYIVSIVKSRWGVIRLDIVSMLTVWWSWCIQFKWLLVRTMQYTIYTNNQQKTDLLSFWNHKHDVENEWRIPLDKMVNCWSEVSLTSLCDEWKSVKMSEVINANARHVWKKKISLQPHLFRKPQKIDVTQSSSLHPSNGVNIQHKMYCSTLYTKESHILMNIYSWFGNGNATSTKSHFHEHETRELNEMDKLMILDALSVL